MRSVRARHVKMSMLATIIAYFVIVTAVLSSTNVAAIGVLTQDYLTLSFLDVGQGDSIWLQTPDNHNCLVDGGEANKGAAVAGYLRGHGAVICSPGARVALIGVCAGIAVKLARITGR